MKRMSERQQSVIAFMITVALITLGATACKKRDSPTATFEAFYEAIKNKDVQAYKKTVSKGSLEMLERAAKELDKSLDEYINLEMNKPSLKLPDKLETRNEKITGDRATLEIKNNEGGWSTVPFVKEDGQWKVAVDEI